MNQFFQHDFVLIARALDEWADTHYNYIDEEYPVDETEGYDFNGTEFERGCHLLLIAHAQALAYRFRQLAKEPAATKTVAQHLETQDELPF